MKGGKNTGRTDELRYLPFSFPLCPVVCSGSSGSLTPGFLRCVAQNPRIQLTLNLIQRIQYSCACVFFFQQLALLIEIRRTAHCHLTVCKCKPCQQRKYTCSDRIFSWDYDPYTHACKARPLTTVGWTSLSVIVIVIVIERRQGLEVDEQTDRKKTLTLPVLGADQQTGTRVD